MSNPEEGANQAAFAILEAELSRLCEATRETWQGYLKWFTWSMGTQSVVLGWVMTKGQPSTSNMIVLTSTLAVLNVFGLMGALWIRPFAKLQGSRADAVCRVMTDRAETSGLNISITPAFSGDFISLSAGLCAGAETTAAVAWLFLLCREVFPQLHHHAMGVREIIIAAIAAVF